MTVPKKNNNTLILALFGILLKTDIVIAINSYIPNKENTLRRSNIPNICCHHTESSMLKLSSHFENILSITTNRNIKKVFIILFFIFKLLSGILIFLNNFPLFFPHKLLFYFLKFLLLFYF